MQDKMKHKKDFPILKIFWMLIFCMNFIPVYADIFDAVFVNQHTDLIINNNKLYISRSYELQINNRQ